MPRGMPRAMTFDQPIPPSVQAPSNALRGKRHRRYPRGGR